MICLTFSPLLLLKFVVFPVHVSIVVFVLMETGYLSASAFSSSSSSPSIAPPAIAPALVAPALVVSALGRLEPVVLCLWNRCERYVSWWWWWREWRIARRLSVNQCLWLLIVWIHRLPHRLLALLHVDEMLPLLVVLLWYLLTLIRPWPAVICFRSFSFRIRCRVCVVGSSAVFADASYLFWSFFLLFATSRSCFLLLLFLEKSVRAVQEQSRRKCVSRSLDLNSLRWGWCPLLKRIFGMTKEDANMIRCLTARSIFDPKSVALLSLVGRRY